MHQVIISSDLSRQPEDQEMDWVHYLPPCQVGNDHCPYTYSLSQTNGSPQINNHQMSYNFFFSPQSPHLPLPPLGPNPSHSPMDSISYDLKQQSQIVYYGSEIQQEQAIEIQTLKLQKQSLAKTTKRISKKERLKKIKKNRLTRTKKQCPCCQQLTKNHDCPHNKCFKGSLCERLIRREVDKKRKINQKERRERKALEQAGKSRVGSGGREDEWLFRRE